MSYTDYINRLGRTSESDECYTPSNAVTPLIDFIDMDKMWYEATSGISSQLLEGLKSNGVKVKGSGGRCFFESHQNEEYDGIITNPPYSKKDDFIKKCYEIGKPFALLLPVAAAQGIARGRLYKDLGISMLVYNKRIDFTGKGQPPFGVAWFMGNGFCEPNRLWFTDFGVK